MQQLFFLHLTRFLKPGYGVALIVLLSTVILACGVSTLVPTPGGAPLATKTYDGAHPHLVGVDAIVSSLVFAFSATSAPSSSLPAPTDLDATAGHAQVSLTWNGVKGASGYFVWWRDVTVGQTTYTRSPYPVTGTSYTVQPLTSGDRYCFIVTAFNANGGSGPSNIACATPT